MEKLFKTYEKKYANIGLSQKIKEVVSCDVGIDFLNAFLMGQGDMSATTGGKNALRFPIIACIAKVTTVASESAFSTCSRILNEYKTCLNTPIVEVLVCTEDWVRKSRKPIIDDDEDIEGW
uniref:HAT C-terminal dimerisation domain-containing protein n=1 Tax=Lactuca sativa TaxID=4236 RepID=A0A9R1XKY1_LACSA|nr:hypothetical protein LSAT_V11C400202530 [Lactuca sativa]